VLSPEGQEQYREAFDCLAGAERRYETSSEMTALTRPEQAAGSEQSETADTSATPISEFLKEEAK
jgi:hypothetical protein